MGHSLIYQPYISGNIPGYWVEGRFRSWETDKGQFGGCLETSMGWIGMPTIETTRQPHIPKIKNS